MTQAAAGTSGTTDHVWTLIGVYGLQAVAPLIYLATFDIGDFIRFEFDPSAPLAMYGLVFTPAAFIAVGVALLSIPALIWLSYADYKALVDRGLPSPFHWLTSLIPCYGPLIYVVGRSVIVYRRTGGGLAPLWVFVAVNIAALIVWVIVPLMVFADMMSHLSRL